MKFSSVASPLLSLARYLLAGLVGCVVAGCLFLAYLLEQRPELSVWHLADLDQEFTASTGLTDFQQYLQLEDRLFRQLDELVYAKVPVGRQHAVDRYSRGSLADPNRWSENWNRTFRLYSETPRAGILMLHGLSDSPYSMRALGQSLHRHGATVVGLRIPGHGTAPTGLVEIAWQDMAAAVRLAVRHLEEMSGGMPIYVVGYSNGGALAMEYVLATLDDPSLPNLSGVILLSPEIGVSPAAALAVWQGRIGHALGLEKLAWNSLTPEYDPFKYGSFAVNAGDLAYLITQHLEQRLAELEEAGKLEELPPILAFQSAVDATVTTSALVANLFNRLPGAGHELVLFDINRRLELSALLRQDPRTELEPLLGKGGRPFALTLVTNAGDDTNRVVAQRRAGGDTRISRITPVGEWPLGVFSLSHVALPFAPTDPVYGGPEAAASPGIQLGNLAPKGERNVLHVSGNDLLRLRWNPFFDYLESCVLQFTGLQD